MELLKRVSYGSNYNHIFIDYRDNIIIKVCHNKEGSKKINCEIKFLKFIIDNNIQFPIPKIFSFGKEQYKMEFLKNYNPLYLEYTYLSNLEKEEVKNKIKSYLDNLHKFHSIEITFEEYVKNLKLETETKLIERYNKIKNIIGKYEYIKKVNGILLIYSFEELLIKLNLYILEHVKKKMDYKLVVIHGDCQFNNILYHKLEHDIIFIDPRAYYGGLELYGIKEYDFAKIKFAISGYDEFDNRQINKLDINHDEISININPLENFTFEDNMETLLMLTMWLSNAHSFIDNEYKLVSSYFIGLYYSIQYLNKFF